MDVPTNEAMGEITHGKKEKNSGDCLDNILHELNIPDKFPSAVRRNGNHFLDSLLCILNHNFYRDICKGCSTPQMRQGLDKYSHRNRNCN